MNDTSDSKIITPEQRRAKAAWGVVKSIDKIKPEEISKLCKQTASRMLNSGIMPSLSFLNTKNDEGHKLLLNAFDNQLNNDGEEKGLFSFISGTQTSMLDRLIQSADSSTLRRAQTEALAYLEWLVRFAEGKAKQ